MVVKPLNERKTDLKAAKKENDWLETRSVEKERFQI